MSIAQKKPVYGKTPAQLIEEFGSKSGAIRHLDSIGWNRTQIADFLDLRYQHVRTVLITPLTSTRGRRGSRSKAQRGNARTAA